MGKSNCVERKAPNRILLGMQIKRRGRSVPGTAVVVRIFTYEPMLGQSNYKCGWQSPGDSTVSLTGGQITVVNLDKLFACSKIMVRLFHTIGNIFHVDRSPSVIDHLIDHSASFTEVEIRQSACGSKKGVSDDGEK